jgi:lipopolysaccharide export system permease protein
VADVFSHLSKFISTHTPILEVLTYYAWLLVPAFEMLAPASLLLATLYTLARLTRFSELTAMRAAGLSTFRLMRPFLGVGLAFVAITGVVRESLSSRALMYTDDFFKRKEHPEAFTTEHHNVAFYNGPAKSLWWIDKLDLKDPSRLTGVLITRESGAAGHREEIAAARAEWLDGAWWFFDFSREVTDGGDLIISRSLPTSRPIEVRDIRDRPQDFVYEIRVAEEWEMLSLRDQWSYLKRHSYLPSKDLSRKSVYFHQRWAMPWTCLIVILFGIPAGARTSRSGAMLGILLALTFFFGFYSLIQIGLYMGIQGVIPAWTGAWLPNIIFAAIGVGMMTRMR